MSKSNHDDLLEDFKDMMCMSLPVHITLAPEKDYTFYFWDAESETCDLSTDDDTATITVRIDDCEVYFPWAWRHHTMPLRQALQWIEQMKGDEDGQE